MKLGRIARLYLPPTFVLTALAVPRTPQLGTGVHLLAGWANPPSEPQSDPSGAGAGEDGGLEDAGVDSGADAGTIEHSGCGGNERFATTSTLGAGCC